MSHFKSTATRHWCWCISIFLVNGLSVRGDDFDVVRPLLEQNCIACHGDGDVNGEVDLKQIASRQQFLDEPELLSLVIDAIDGNNMPPEDEQQLTERERTQLLASLKSMLRESVASNVNSRLPLRRLNRFQYNYAVKDLFKLRSDVFPLPEKLMTRHSDYLQRDTWEMPQRVEAMSYALEPSPGLQGVQAFPKDLRAQHGFDNQANELTLSPLLLDAFLRLSVSIVESPDFNEQNVGVWSNFFAAPDTQVNNHEEIQRRLPKFLKIAFRGPVDDSTINRYSQYALKKVEEGLSFSDSMKKVAAAVLSSPRFLYRSTTPESVDDQFELASKLSFFLWSSGPDEELLQLAEQGELNQPVVLHRTIDRLCHDPRIERFLDTFPTQWMQLENALGVTPDPDLNRYFRLDPKKPACVHMVLEPLLLFDAIFVEDRPITELIKPAFSYRSEFLTSWYTSELKPRDVDTKAVHAENQRNHERREQLKTSIENRQEELQVLKHTVTERLLAIREKETGEEKSVDLKPYAAWEFNGDLKESIRALDFTPHGEVAFKDGMVVLNKSYLLSQKLPIDLQAKTLEVWCQLDDLDQRGGGVMGIQGPGGLFDTIVIGERQPRHWISGSNNFARTEDFPESTPESITGELLHLVMVYSEDGTTTMYRNGEKYGKPYRKGQMTFPKEQSFVILGLRHLPPGGNRYLNVKIDKARLYNRALTAEEVGAAVRGGSYISEKELLAGMTPHERKHNDFLAESMAMLQSEMKAVPPHREIAKVQEEVQQQFDQELLRQLSEQTFQRVALEDPRYGGIITNAAMLSMTSGPKRTHPIARGAWIVEVILNDPPPPPPNDVPPLNEDAGGHNLTIRERFAAHRDHPSCAGCHSRIDPLGFALENFDITGRWRDHYPNGRNVDSSGKLLRKYEFDSVVQFKESLCKEEQRFAKAFTEHLLRFATSRELTPADKIAVDSIVQNATEDDYRLKTLIREVVLSDSFHTTKGP